MDAKCHRPFRHFPSYSAKAENPKCFSGELIAGHPTPLESLHCCVLLRDVPKKGEHQSEGVFGDGSMVYSWGIADRNTELFRHLKVNLVESDSVPADHFGMRVNFTKNCGGKMVLADEKSVERALSIDNREKLSLRKGPSGLNEGEITRSELSNVRTRGIKEARGGDKDAHEKYL
jgi:hypothetical protein